MTCYIIKVSACPVQQACSAGHALGYGKVSCRAYFILSSSASCSRAKNRKHLCQSFSVCCAESAAIACWRRYITTKQLGQLYDESKHNINKLEYAV